MSVMEGSLSVMEGSLSVMEGSLSVSLFGAPKRVQVIMKWFVVWCFLTVPNYMCKL